MNPNDRHRFQGVGDRNQRALREHHHKQFVERVAAGLVHPQDRVGKPLHVGDIVQWHPSLQPICQIMEINVMPLGTQPPEGSGGVEIIIALSAPLTAHVEHPLGVLTKVKDAALAGAGASEPPADPPPDAEPTDDAPDR